MGSLIDGARAWRHFIVGCTDARFCMPYLTPNLLTSLGFCQWYRFSNSNPSEFNINSTGTKLIFKRLKQKAGEQGQGKRVRVPGLLEFLAEAVSEASDIESPRFEDVDGGEAAPEATSGAGKAPLEEKEEEEYHNTHFKREQKKPEPKELLLKNPLGRSLLKKRLVRSK